MSQRTDSTIAPDEAQHAAELLELGDAFFELDRDWRIVRVNRRLEEVTGKPRAETLGRTFAEVWPEVVTPASVFWRECHRCMEERVPVLFHEYCPRLELWAGVSAYPIATGGIAVFFRDLTAIKRGAREQARLAAIVESSDDAIISKDLDGTVTTWNTAAERLFGYAADEIIGRPIRILLPPDRLEEEDRILDELRAGRRIDHFRTTRVRKDGSTVEVSVTISPLRDDSGEIVGASKIARDITERTRAERALKASEEKFRSVFESAMVGVGRIAFDGRFIEVNAAYADIVGYSREELMALRFQDITHPDDLDKHVDQFAALARGRIRSYQLEKRYVRRDGTVIWVSVSVGLAVDPEGKPAYCAVIAEDITERKRAEEALRASEETFRSVLENMSEGLMLFDASGNIIFQNPASLRTLEVEQPSEGRFTRDELRARWRAWDERGRPLPFEAWPMGRVLRGERVQDQVLHAERANGGGRFYASCNGFPIRDADGRLIRGFITIRDITGQVRAKAEQERADAALRHANERLREADRRKDEFLGMLSHELRNPLAPIRNSLYILDRAEPTGQQARRAKAVLDRQVGHLTRLVDDLLDVTRIARGKIELRRTDLDLGALVHRTAEDYRALMRDRDLELGVDVTGGPFVVNGDEVRLAQVLGNLLSNAAKFTPAGGRVTLALRRRGERAVVHVRDTGPGIPADVMSRVFEPFTQGKQTLARSQGGLGLGLALVKGLVSLHGGEVAAVSTGPGDGTEFVVTLPLVARDAAGTSETAARPDVHGA
jgi:PAS domain S-box-containing protein